MFWGINSLFRPVSMRDKLFHSCWKISIIGGNFFALRIYWIVSGRQMFGRQVFETELGGGGGVTFMEAFLPFRSSFLFKVNTSEQYFPSFLFIKLCNKAENTDLEEWAPIYFVWAIFWMGDIYRDQNILFW